MASPKKNKPEVADERQMSMFGQDARTSTPPAAVAETSGVTPIPRSNPALTEAAPTSIAPLPIVQRPSVVPGQASGIPYQIRYGALKALELGVDETLTMEEYDDISVIGSRGHSLIQVKNEEKALTDNNVGLWNALANWAKELSRLPPGDTRIHSFIFVTTAQISGTLPKFLVDLDVPQREFLAASCINGLSSDAPSIIESMNVVRALDPERRRELFRRTRIEVEVDADGLQAKIKRKLREKTFPANSLDSAAHEYTGWFNDKALAVFDKNMGFRITGREIFAALENLRNRFTRQSLKFRHETTDVSQSQRMDYRNRLFVRQLEAIELPTIALDMALVDFFRDMWERGEWADDLSVTPAELKSYDNELYQAWRHKFIDIAGKRSEIPTQNGKELYAEIMGNKQSVRLAGDEPPWHVYRGSYHRLADSPRLGWHPQWEKLFAGADSTEEPSAAASEGSDD